MVVWCLMVFACVIIWLLWFVLISGFVTLGFGCFTLVRFVEWFVLAVYDIFGADWFVWMRLW